MLKKSIYILFLFVCSLPLYSQIITVRAGFDADSILIGQQIHFSLIVETAEDVNAALPVYSDTISKSIELLKEFDADTSVLNGRRTITQKYLVTSFEPGWNTVPPQPIPYSTKSFDDTTYTTAALLTVLAPAVDTTKAFMPIKGPVNTPLSFAEIWPWAALGLLILAIIAAAIYFYRRYREKKLDPEGATRKLLDPAHVVAFRELERLRQAKLPQKGMVKEYYSRLTDIIRVYMARQYNIQAMESTTSEILEAFERSNTQEKKLNELLENLLMLADLVKFAKEDSLMEENDRHFANAEYFVESTYKMFREANIENDFVKEEDNQSVEKGDSKSVDRNDADNTIEDREGTTEEKGKEEKDG